MEHQQLVTVTWESPRKVYSGKLTIRGYGKPIVIYEQNVDNAILLAKEFYHKQLLRLNDLACEIDNIK